VDAIRDAVGVSRLVASRHANNKRTDAFIVSRRKKMLEIHASALRAES